MYENSLNRGWFFGDRRMGPIFGYRSTGEVSTHSAGKKLTIRNGIVGLTLLMVVICRALREMVIQDPCQSMNSTLVPGREGHGIESRRNYGSVRPIGKAG